MRSDQLGGYTTDLAMIHLNLAQIGLTVEQLMSKTNPGAGNTFFYSAGGYVAIIQFKEGFTKPNMSFIHFSVDIEKNYDVYAEYYAPSHLKAIHQTQQKIKEKGKDFQEQFELMTPWR
jgi:hypothetical protein